jgi:hypothetical protein
MSGIWKWTKEQARRTEILLHREGPSPESCSGKAPGTIAKLLLHGALSPGAFRRRCGSGFPGGKSLPFPRGTAL